MKTLEINSYQDILIFLQPIAFKFTQDKDEADDLVQDTMIKVFTHQDRFKEGTNLKAWLYTVIRNTFLSKINNFSKRFQHIEPAILNQNTQLATENMAYSEFTTQEIQKAINQLSDLYKVPFMLHFKGFKYTEIAKKLKLPLGTVKNRIFVARKELQIKLQYSEVDG
jgi:RNA polymerase sigma factor (sigma-70 family)